MTCAPASSSVRTHRRLRSSSNRASSSTSTVTCLPWSAARRRACDDRRVAARPVERLLDGEDVGVVGRPHDELDDRVEAVVGVVQQHVAARRGPAKMSARSSSSSASTGRHGTSRSSSRPGSSSRRHQRAEVQGAGESGRCPAALDADLLDQHGQQLVAGPGLDLEPHDVTAPPAPQFLFDHLEVRTPAFVVELDLRVARQADDGRLEDRLPGKQQLEMRPDHVLEEDEREARRSRPRARGAPAWPAPARSPAAGVRPAAAGASQTATLRLSDESIGNGRDTSMASGVRTGSTLFAEVGRHGRALAHPPGPRRRRARMPCSARAGRRSPVTSRYRSAHQRVRTLRDRGQLLRRRQPGEVGLVTALAHLVLERRPRGP